MLFRSVKGSQFNNLGVGDHRLGLMERTQRDAATDGVVGDSCEVLVCERISVFVFGGPAVGVHQLPFSEGYAGCLNVEGVDHDVSVVRLLLTGGSAESSLGVEDVLDDAVTSGVTDGSVVCKVVREVVDGDVLS